MLPPARLTSHLLRFASIAAGIAIFVAPFRASAGVRGAMLVLAGLALLFVYRRAGHARFLLPHDMSLAIAVGAWLLSASLWSLLSPSPLESLSIVKRDVLTPMLAFMVFYALTRTRADLMRWISIIVAGLVVLTIMIIIEPFDPLATLQQSDYLTVGLLTTWIVTLAPLLAMLLFAGRRWRVRARVLLAVALPCLLVSAWLSGNRTVWVCFASMLLVALIGSTRSRGVTPRRSAGVLAMLLALLALMLALMLASMQFRANTQAPTGTGAFTFMLQDNRAPILRASAEMIAERPLAGLGYANPDMAGTFAARLEAPWLKNYVQHAHNVVLNHALQMGLIGALVILVLFAALAWTFASRVPVGGLARLAGVCGLALVTGVFLRNMTDDFFSRHTVQFFGAVLGMLLGLATRRSPLNTRCRGS